MTMPTSMASAAAGCDRAQRQDSVRSLATNSGDEGLCLISDAETNGGVLQRFTIGPDGALSRSDQVKIDTGIGLPPHKIGEF